MQRGKRATAVVASKGSQLLLSDLQCASKRIELRIVRDTHLTGIRLLRRTHASEDSNTSSHTKDQRSMFRDGEWSSSIHSTARHRRDQVDHGTRVGLTSDERARLKALEREDRDLRRANEVLKDASIFFATELDGRTKR